MLVKDSNYKVCTIIADPSGTANPVDLHLISHTGTSFPEAMLSRLRDRLGRFFQEELGLEVSSRVPSEGTESSLEDGGPVLLSDDQIEDDFNKEIETLEDEIDRTAEDDLVGQGLQRGMYWIPFPFRSCLVSVKFILVDGNDNDFAEEQGRNVATQGKLTG